MHVNEVLVDLIADAIGAGALILIGYIAWVAAEHQPVLRFFGVNKGQTKVNIILSRVEIEKSGTTRKFDDRARDYVGPLIGFTEYRAALMLQRQLQSRLLVHMPSRLVEILRRTWKTIAIEPSIELCPMSVDFVPNDITLRQGTLILLGSSTYNSATKYYSERFRLLYDFDYDRGRLVVKKNRRQFRISDEEKPAPRLQERFGVVQRISLPGPTPHRTVLICAGSGQTETQACVKWLIKEWKDLQKRYGSKDFAILLEMPANVQDTQDESNGDAKEIDADSLEEGEVISERALIAGDHQSSEFFTIGFAQFVEQLDSLRLHLSEAVSRCAPGLQQNPLLVDVVVPGGSIKRFRLGECTLAEADGPTVPNDSFARVTYNAFRDIIFPDLARWQSPEEALGHLRRTYQFQDREHVAHVCLSWYPVYKEAAERAFLDPKYLSEYWSRFATHWWNDGKLDSREHWNYADELRKHINVKGKSVLEIGCGYGRVSEMFCAEAKWVAADVSHEMLKKVRSRTRDGAAVVVCGADANRIPFRPGFEVILALQLMVHLSNPFDVLRSLAMLLTPNGHLWVDFTCTTRPMQSNYVQESFFSRIYKKEYVEQQCRGLGFSLRCYEVHDRNEHFWLVMRLSKQ